MEPLDNICVRTTCLLYLIAQLSSRPKSFDAADSLYGPAIYTVEVKEDERERP